MTIEMKINRNEYETKDALLNNNHTDIADISGFLLSEELEFDFIKERNYLYICVIGKFRNSINYENMSHDILFTIKVHTKIIDDKFYFTNEISIETENDSSNLFTSLDDAKLFKQIMMKDNIINSRYFDEHKKFFIEHSNIEELKKLIHEILPNINENLLYNSSL